MHLLGKNLKAHRVAWEVAVGPIPDGLQIDHLCKNRLCVNPDHLEPVTCRENLMRADTIQAKNAAKTHCIHGHEFTPENTQLVPVKQGRYVGRSCLACRRRREQERRQRRSN